MPLEVKPRGAGLYYFLYHSYMKPQICIIHGGETYPNDDEYRAVLESKDLSYERLLYAPSWKNWLAEQLTDHDVLMPSMPNKQNAKYDEWATYFSKVVSFLRSDATLIGHSLGGIFLCKYFLENVPIRPYGKLILVAAPYDDETGESLGGFRLEDTTNLPAIADQIHLFYSTDDPVVPVSEKDKYLLDAPSAISHIFADRQHFNGPSLPELLQLID